MKKASRVLTVADIARERGISLKRAWRMLRRIESARPDAVHRVGHGPRAALTITVAALQSVDPSWVEEDRLGEVDDLRAELQAIRESFVALERRQKKLEAALAQKK
jgi:hypothetical protein